MVVMNDSPKDRCLRVEKSSNSNGHGQRRLIAAFVVVVIVGLWFLLSFGFFSLLSFVIITR